MNVSIYAPDKRMEREAIGSIDLLPSVKEVLHESAAPGNGSEHETDANVAEDTLEIDGALLGYALDERGRVHIVSCKTSAPRISVPERIDGHCVVVIGSHSFSTCYKLEIIELPDTIEDIREHAFMNTALERFVAPPHLRSVGAKAFFKCTRLKEVVLNDELVSIGAQAFCESKLEHLEVPASVQSIGRDAFKSTQLTFSGENQSMLISDDNDRYGVEDGVLYEALRDGLHLVQVLDSTLQHYIGPSGLVQVSDRAFLGLNQLEVVVLPEGVVSVGEAAFKGCTCLKRVDLPDSLASIGRRAFWGTALESLRIPAHLEAVGAAAFYTGDAIARNFKPSIRRIEIAPENTRFYMENDALCQRLSNGGAIALLHIGDGPEVVIPRSVTHIGPYAYTNSTHARRLTIHDRLETIDVGGLDLGRSVPTVVCETSDEPPKSYVINYPPGEVGFQAMRSTFGRGRFDMQMAYAECDSAIIGTRDMYMRARMMLERLADPVFLSERKALSFKNQLALMVPATVVNFGRNGYLRGIDLLLDQGFLNEDTIQDAIDEAIAAEEVATVSRLVEIRRTHFGMPLFDFDL